MQTSRTHRGRSTRTRRRRPIFRAGRLRLVGDTQHGRPAAPPRRSASAELAPPPRTTARSGTCRGGGRVVSLDSRPMASWDRLDAKKLATQRDAGGARAGGRRGRRRSAPWWRDRLRAPGAPARSPHRRRRPSRRCPPPGSATSAPTATRRARPALVLQAGEVGYALHAEGPQLRSRSPAAGAARRRTAPVSRPDTRPTSFVWAGLSMRFPVASTRSDLDVVARAAPAVAGPRPRPAPTSWSAPCRCGPPPPHRRSSSGALGASSPLLAPGARPERVAEALRLVPATVLVVPVESAVELLGLLAEAGAPLAALRTLRAERSAVRRRARAGAGGPRGRRCAGRVRRAGGARARRPPAAVGGVPASQGRTGLHTYPDLELLQTVDPESGEAARPAASWCSPSWGCAGPRCCGGGPATGRAVHADACPTAAAPSRAPSARRGALVPRGPARARRPRLRAVARRSPAGRRRRLAVELARSPRDGAEQLRVHVAARGRRGAVAVDGARRCGRRAACPRHQVS
jgi:hypothetical protein